MFHRILVISNNGFSETSNNGRTVGNFFVGWPKEKLAQFCISISIPNMELCNNYYIVTDTAALKAFKHLKKAKRVSLSDAYNTEGRTTLKKSGKKFIKTPTISLLRNIVWSNKRWKSNEFIKWVDDFNPEAVFVIMSDSIFIHNIALDIATERRIPLFMYCSEGYYLFKHSYMPIENIMDSITYPLYSFFYKRNYKKMMRQISHTIYCNAKLEEDYQKVFNHNSSVLYTSSQMTFDESDINLSTPIFTYLGNFGFNRPMVLIEIANILHNINPNYKLKVYGYIKSEEIRKKLASCEAISIKGHIPYSEVKEVITKSTILFHGESQEKQWQEALKYGFTTKIADSISSGHCFLMYSSHEIAGAKYIIDTDSGWFAENKEELQCAILEILNDSEARMKKKNNAKKIALQNHNIEKNCKKFQDIISCEMENVKIEKDD